MTPTDGTASSCTAPPLAFAAGRIQRVQRSGLEVGRVARVAEPAFLRAQQQRFGCALKLAALALAPRTLEPTREPAARRLPVRIPGDRAGQDDRGHRRSPMGRSVPTTAPSTRI